MGASRSRDCLWFGGQVWCSGRDHTCSCKDAGETGDVESVVVVDNDLGDAKEAVTKIFIGELGEAAHFGVLESAEAPVVNGAHEANRTHHGLTYTSRHFI
jgi:hypothetical protein